MLQVIISFRFGFFSSFRKHLKNCLKRSIKKHSCREFKQSLLCIMVVTEEIRTKRSLHRISS